MSNHLDDFDKELDDLLANRKRGISSPDSIKRQIMLRAAQKSKGQRSHLLEGMLAAAAILTVVVGLLEFTVWPEKSVGEFAVVEYHKMTGERDSVSDELAVMRQEYQASSKLSESIASIKMAKIISVNNGMLELVTCENTKLQLSKNLMQHLRDMHRISIDFDVGDTVMLATSSKGQIININDNSEGRNSC